jgi:hypothetical protein
MHHRKLHENGQYDATKKKKRKNENVWILKRLVNTETHTIVS